MCLGQSTLVLLCAILILSTFQERAEGIRFCGKRLADLLNFICEKHGGFHAPRSRRDVSNRTSKRAVIEVLEPVTGSLIPGAASEDAAKSSNNGEIIFNYESGIVDECCRKQCTLATVVSYCANVQQSQSINLEDIFPSGIQKLTEDNLVEYQVRQRYPQQLPLVDSSNGAVIPPSTLSGHIAYASRPNLELSPRNRPVFIVLPEPQEDEDRALGEYRF